MSPPLPDVRPYLKMLVIQPGPKTSWLILSERMFQWEVHFMGERNKPCVKHLGMCPNCTPFNRPRWAGFLAVMHPLVHTLHMLHITPGAIQNCPPLRKQDGILRGLVIQAWRKGRGTKSGLCVQLSQPDSLFRLPGILPVVNVPLAMSRWWDCDPSVLLGSPEEERIRVQ